MAWLLFIAFYIVLDIYAFQAFRTIIHVRWAHYLYFGISAVLLSGFIYLMENPLDGTLYDGLSSYALGLVLTFVVLKLILAVFMFGEDLVRFLITGWKKVASPRTKTEIPSRRKFISTLAWSLAAIPFGGLIYGMIKGKYDFQVLKYELTFEDLPEALDGYQITHISDLHCGSFNNYEKVKYGIDMANSQNSDVLVFTGDLVNARASETEEWQDLFSQLEAPDGVFSIFGNHDYGIHGGNWKNEAERLESIEELKQIERKMGWDLLLNENRTIKRKGQKLHIVGVENWGEGGFVKYGDLEKAGKGLQKNDFKILLSHDPSHWDEKVQQNDKNYQLTLSGHTHGMQFGIEIPGVVKWSPIRYRYQYWAGVYKKFGRWINVNRGLGYLGYPGRFGIWPEISVIKLKKGSPEKGKRV